MSYIYRNCSRPGGFTGDMRLYMLHNHQFYVQVEGLHQNGLYGCYEPICSQADVMIDMDPLLIERKSMYDIVQIILNKITHDHQYIIRENPVDDYVVLDEFANTIVSLRDTPGNLSSLICDVNNEIGHHLKLTRENFHHVDVCNIEEWIGILNENQVVIRGQIDADGNFTYDYPIVGRDVSREYYEDTRGKCVQEFPSRTIETK